MSTEIIMVILYLGCILSGANWVLLSDVTRYLQYLFFQKFEIKKEIIFHYFSYERICKYFSDGFVKADFQYRYFNLQLYLLAGKETIFSVRKGFLIVQEHQYVRFAIFSSGKRMIYFHSAFII